MECPIEKYVFNLRVKKCHLCDQWHSIDRRTDRELIMWLVLAIETTAELPACHQLKHILFAFLESCVLV